MSTRVPRDRISKGLLSDSQEPWKMESRSQQRDKNKQKSWRAREKMGG